MNTISFTGGTATGEVIARAAAPKFKKIALELGGKNPNIIFADADFDEVIPASLRSSFANQGQVCLCGSRVFVEQQRYDEFVDRFVTATRKLKIGDPLDESTDHGAQVSQAQLDKVRYYVELAKDEGGEKEELLESFVGGLSPCRWEHLRPRNKQEAKAATVFSMPIDEGSAKVRSGPPVDDDEDYSLPIWAGLLPVSQVLQDPVPDPKNIDGLEVPAHIRDFKLG